ncbi:MAG: hypothetical protein KZQ66_12895 [Candidatus Thiodiazotropha sp. (ex Lucinoma aequizonata)]|nr:hypothetical protein [Candidatus Thiodiazotropha sp. (ex Lucinoma aequizonata)]MCU7902779.1 hypothetical protein [Candidatus Thiodiazotropha sp. (ex Lucinoma aequizonata)]MCU7913973.1 hypothetical protein [Candidatus Thiodiazotropha sp. (ex Lucinoma aequizonata)]
MSFEITNAFVQQYNSNVQLLLQQRGSRLRDKVANGNYVGKAGKVVEQIGAVTAQRRVNRHGDTPLISTPHDARWVYPNDFELADLINDVDKLRMLIEPTSPYALNGAYAHGRAMDIEIIRAAFESSKTGENGTTVTVFDTAHQQVPVQESSTNTGLTLNKLRQAKKILLANEVDVNMEPLYIAVTAEQLDDLLNTKEITSADYNTIKALVHGEVSSFMGFEFVHTELLPIASTNIRRLIAWAKSGIHYRTME